MTFYFRIIAAEKDKKENVVTWTMKGCLTIQEKSLTEFSLWDPSWSQ